MDGEREQPPAIVADRERAMTAPRSTLAPRALFRASRSRRTFKPTRIREARIRTARLPQKNSAPTSFIHGQRAATLSTDGERFMKRFFFAPAIMLTLAGLLSTAFAQTRATGRAPQTSVGTRVAVPLPASDAVLTADLKRILTEAAPQALASDSQRLAQLNADVDEFKRRMGVDAREFDTLAVGAHLTRLPSGAAKVADVVAVARGTFDSNALIARTRAAAGTRLSEQTYGGKTLYVVAVNDSVKLFGLL